MTRLTPIKKRIPTHPTLVYVIKVLYYSGYLTAITYLVGIFIIRPLILNKKRLLKGFYNFNISKLRDLCGRLTKRFSIVPGINLENTNGTRYTDETMETDDSTSSRTRFRSEGRNMGDPVFKDLEYVSSCDQTLRVAKSSVKTLEILSKKLEIISQSDLEYKKIYGDMSAFNNELQFVKFGRSNAIDKNRVSEEIKGKIRQMKGQVIMR